MVKQANRAIDGQSFKELLRASCVDKGDEGFDIAYGWGLVNAGNLADALSQIFGIFYECNGGSLTGEPGVDYAVRYTVDRTTPVVRPVPERDGHVFAGWFDNAVWAGIIQGKPGGRLDLKGTATRAEVAAIMHRLSSWIA